MISQEGAWEPGRHCPTQQSWQVWLHQLESQQPHHHLRMWLPPPPLLLLPMKLRPWAAWAAPAALVAS
jgi:hypothetical protein